MEPQVIQPQQSSSEPPKDREVSISVDHTPVQATQAPLPPAPPEHTQLDSQSNQSSLPAEPPGSVQSSTPEPTVPWQFSDDQSFAPLPDQPQESISWSASEFIAYQKSFGWYIQILLVVLMVSGAVYLLTHDLISTGSVVLIGVLFIIFAGRKPRVLNYRIDEAGIHIGDKLYPFTILRSFAVIDEGNFHSITLLPLQRFMPSISMYYEPQEEGRIVEILGGYLPKEDRKQDVVDRFMHKIRF